MNAVVDAAAAGTKPLVGGDTDQDGTALGRDGRAGGRMARWMIAAIHGYQLARSGRPTGCRYLPTCSEYGVQAIERYGPLRGASLALRRLARCNPWGGHGVDPVPDRRATCSDQ